MSYFLGLFSKTALKDLPNFLHDCRGEWGALFDSDSFSEKILNHKLSGIKCQRIVFWLLFSKMVLQWVHSCLLFSTLSILKRFLSVFNVILTTRWQFLGNLSVLHEFCVSFNSIYLTCKNNSMPHITFFRYSLVAENLKRSFAKTSFTFEKILFSLY